MPDSPARTAAALAPTPTEPVGGDVVALDAATFRWAAPPGASAFDLRIATADAPGTPVVELDGLPTTETTLADALPAGPCLWWVRKAGGSWGKPARFVAGTPADLEVAAQEAAEAAERERAAQREVRRQPDAIPEAPPEPEWPHASGPSLDGAPPLDWSTVPGFAAPGREDGPTVAAAPPRPLAPLGGEVVDAVTVSLRWAGVPGATGYDVELSPHAGFDRDVLALDAGEATEVTLPGIVPATGHRLLWRVRARSAKGSTAWSKYGRFYPASGPAADRFRADLDAAMAAQRKRLAHDALVRQRELDLVPLHQREDSVSAGATYTALVLMMASSIVVALAVLVFSLLRF